MTDQSQSPEDLVFDVPAESNSSGTLQYWGATVTNIVDGDTFDVTWDNGFVPPAPLLNRIRVAGVDTNETTSNQSFSAEATARLAQLLPIGTHVQLAARDVNSNSEDRPVRHVFVNNQNIALTLIEEGLGLAVNYEFEPDFFAEIFQAGEQAQLNGVGMWAKGASGGDLNTWSDVEMFVNYDARGDDFLNVDDEYIHIKNTGPFSVDISGWTMRKSGKSTTVEIPDGTVLGVGDEYRIYVGVGTNTSDAMYLGYTEPFFDNEGDIVYLRDEFLNIRGYQGWPDTIFTGPESSIVIDDVQYNAPGADDATNPNGEWIVIRNAGHETVDLSHYRIKDNSDDYVFQPGETLEAGKSIKIFLGTGTDSVGIRYWGKTTGILNNDNGKIEVWTPRSHPVDTYVWGTEQSTDENPRGAIRMFANYDGEGSDTTNPNGEWVALYNSSDSDIDLSGFTLKSGSHVYTFADGTMLTSGMNMRVMVGSGTDTATQKFWGKTGGILSNSGDQVDLINDEDEILLRHEWTGTNPVAVTDYGIVIEHVNYDAIGSDSANPNGEWFTIRNGSSTEQNLVNWKIVVGSKHLVLTGDHILASGETLKVFIGSGINTNNAVYWGESSGILYNTGSRAIELYAPNRDLVESHSWGSATSNAQSVAAAIDMSANYDAQGSDSTNLNGEWINLVNTSSSTISLDGYQIYTDGTSYTFGVGDVIAAGERMRIYLGNGTDSGLDRYANGTLNGLNNTSDLIELRRTDTGGVVDSFEWPFTGQPPFIKGSFEITAVNWNAPGVDETNPNGEWIEITNTGSEAANLRDWRVQYQTGTFFDFHENAIVAAGASIKIFMGQGTNTATEFYWGNTGAALNNTNGDLILQTNYRLTADTFSWRDGNAVDDGSSSQASIVIDDVQYNAPGSDSSNPNGEWIIIRNAGHETVDLAGWRIKDDSADYIFGAGETLEAGKTLKIFIGSGTDSDGIRYWGNSSGILNNDNGKLTVQTPLPQIVDAFTWGTELSENENPRGAIRMFANYDTEGSDDANPNGEWVALVNTSDSAVDLGGYSLKSGSDVYTFAIGTTLAAGAHLRVLVGIGTDTATEFHWGKTESIFSNSGDKVDLINDDNDIILRHEWPNPESDITDYGIVIESVNYDAPGSDSSNPNGEFITLRNSSSAEQSLLNWKIVVAPKQLVILEDRTLEAGESITIFIGSGTNTDTELYWGLPGGILYNTGSRSVEIYNPNRDLVESHSWGSSTSTDQSVSAAIDITINYDAEGTDSANLNGEWINLTNLSSSAISLDGYHIYTDGTKYTFDAGDVIGAGERMRIYLGNGTDSGLDRYANGTLNGFNNTADGLELRRDDTGTAVDSFDYPFTKLPTVQSSFKITSINVDAPGVDATNPNGEWIEITNTGSTSANLRDFRVIYQTGTFFDFNDSVIVAAGASVKIFMGQGTNTATEFYWGNTEAALSNTEGMLTLQTNYRTEAHKVTWQNGSVVDDPEGTAASIVIDDVQYNAPGSDSSNPNGEWIIIRNAGHETVDLAGWRIKDDSADYIFGAGETLEAGKTLKIFIGSGTDSDGIRYWGNSSGILNNDNGKLTVQTPLPQIVDAFTWGTELSENENPRGAIRMFANYDTEGSDDANPNGEWVALVNTSDSAVDLGGYSLKSGSDVYTFAIGTTLAAGAHLRVLVGIGTDTATEFHWGKTESIFSNSGDKVDLINDDNDIILRHEWPNPESDITDYGIVIESVNYDAPGSDSSNPNGEFITLRNSSSAEQSLLNWKIVVGPKQLVILEDRTLEAGESITIFIGSGTNTDTELYWGLPGGILYNTGSRSVEIYNPNRDLVESHSWGSSTSTDQSVSAAIDITINYDAEGTDSANLNGEWINLTNLSSSAISLDGYHIYTDGTKYTFDAGDVIGAGERMRIYLGNGTDSGLDRYANGTLNGFNNTADGLELRRDDTGTAVDSFDYPFTKLPTVQSSFKITSINVDAPGVDATNPNGEWIEITNTGSTSANLRDFRVIYQTGTFFDFNDSVIVAAGASVKIFMGQGTNTATEFYWGNTEAALSNTEGMLTLQTNYRTEAHKVTWQNGSVVDDPEGTAASIVIDDVQYNAPGSDSSNPNGEWIIIRNAGHETVDLAGWRIKDDSADYIFGAGETLEAGKTLKIFIGSGTDSDGIRYWANSSGILNNDNGKLTVQTPLPQIVDAFTWGTELSENENPRGAIRMFANYDGEGSDTSNPNGEWVALANTSDSAIDLSGFKLVSGSHEYTFAQGTILSAGMNLRVMVGSGTDTATQKFWGKTGGILSNSGDQVDLIDDNSDTLLRHEWTGTNPVATTDHGIVISHVNYDAPGSDSSNPNGEWFTLHNSSSADQSLMNWKIVVGSHHLVILDDRVLGSGESVTVYIGSGTNTNDAIYWGKSSGILTNTGSVAVKLYAPNRDLVESHSWGSATSDAQSVAAAIDMSINYDAEGSDAANPNGEWLNLTNTSSSAISLDGYYIYTDGTTYTFDAGDVIGAGERMRIYLGNGTDNGLDRYANGTLNTFNNTADGVELRRSDTGVKIDSFDYPFNDSAWATPEFRVTQVNEDAVGSDSTNPNGEWIEITNLGSASANLRDWRVVYDSNKFFDFHDSVIVAAGASIKIFMGQGTNTATEFYWGYTSGVLNNTAGDVVLQSMHRVDAHTYSWRNSNTLGDNVTGTDGSNTFRVNGGDDTVSDLGGDDFIFLGDGDDLMIVGGGEDAYYGGAGDDHISYENSPGGITIDLEADTVSKSWGDDDTISDFEHATGSSTGNDKMFGTSGGNLLRGLGGNDSLYGRSGDDTMEGGDGQDRFDGGNGTDTLTGGADADTFHFDKGEDHDIITDFQDDVDVIELDNFTFGPGEDAFDFATELNGNVEFDFGGGDKLTVLNATIAQLQNDVQMV